MTSVKKIQFIDLFAGIGGFHYAFHSHGAECVFASEWDEYARKTYKHNFKDISPGIFRDNDKWFIEDIHNVSDLPEEEIKSSIPDFHVLTGGFPCQPFSQVGKKLGFEDTRGTLFHEIKKILNAKKPAAFFLENVRHLEKHDGGKTIAIIKQELNNLDYSFFSQIVRASDFGLPTHRPRLFMVGFRGDPENKIKFNFPEPKKENAFTLSDLFNGKCTYDKKGTRIRDIGFTLRVGGKGSRIDDRRNWEFYWVKGRLHKITVDECIKMMGFPQDQFEFPDIPQSQKMKQLGNSVAVNAVRATAEAVIKHLGKHGYLKKKVDSEIIYARK